MTNTLVSRSQRSLTTGFYAVMEAAPIVTGRRTRWETMDKGHIPVSRLAEQYFITCRTEGKTSSALREYRVAAHDRSYYSPFLAVRRISHGCPPWRTLEPRVCRLPHALIHSRRPRRCRAGRRPDRARLYDQRAWQRSENKRRHPAGLRGAVKSWRCPALLRPPGRATKRGGKQ